MKTIRKNSVEKFIKRAFNIKVYTLDNGFTGVPVNDLVWAIYLDAKFSYDSQTGTGRARLHSNCWYEFDVKKENV